MQHGASLWRFRRVDDAFAPIDISGQLANGVKLLLKKNELKKLKTRVEDKGMTIVPYRLYLSARGIIKLEINLAEGKKAYDKRETIKEKDNRREEERYGKYTK